MDIPAFRLHSQRISAPRSATPHDVVRHLTAMQAQDYPGALWSIGLRLPGSTVSAIEEAIAKREIVRTWPMRGTLHFVAAEDIRWMLRLLAPRMIKGAAGRFRQLGLDENIMGRSRELLANALAGGKQLTRAELFSAFEAGGIATASQRGVYLLWLASHEGMICFASHAGKQPTFALLEEWLPAAAGPSGDEALAELAYRYITGHGPATKQDLAWWAGLKLSDASKALELASPRLNSQVIADRTYWAAGGNPSSSPEVPYLLPGFDEYLLGYTDRSAVLKKEHMERIVPGGNGMFMPTIISDGTVVGTWKRVIKKSSVEITLLPFAPLPAGVVDALESQAARYGEFLGLKPVFQRPA